MSTATRHAMFGSQDADRPTSARPDSRRGWKVVAAAVIATSVLLGISYAFGALIDPLRAEFDTGHKGAALAFSLTVALPFLLAPLAGPLSDRYGPRPLLATAAALSTAGLLLSSAATSVWVVYLTYGVGVGGASACAFVPMVATVGGWFERRRTLALSVALTGTGAGTLIGAPLIGALGQAYGFRSTCLVLAGVTALSLPLAAMLAAPPPSRGTSAPRAADRADGFAGLYLAGIAGSFSAFIPFAFLVPSAVERGINQVDAAWLLAVAGAANLAARLLVPVVARQLGLLHTYRAAFLALGASGAFWAVADGSLHALILFAFVFGSAYGAFVALSPAVAVDLLGTEALGRRLGALYTSAGIGALLGPLAAGAAVDATGGYGAASALVITAGLAGAIALSGSVRGKFRALGPGRSDEGGTNEQREVLCQESP